MPNRDPPPEGNALLEKPDGKGLKAGSLTIQRFRGSAQAVPLQQRPLHADPPAAEPPSARPAPGHPAARFGTDSRPRLAAGPFSPPQTKKPPSRVGRRAGVHGPGPAAPPRRAPRGKPRLARQAAGSGRPRRRASRRAPGLARLSPAATPPRGPGRAVAPTAAAVTGSHHASIRAPDAEPSCPPQPPPGPGPGLPPAGGSRPPP